MSDAATKEAMTFSGLGYAAAELIAGAFQDFLHVTLTAQREAALALICAALIHRFFSKA